MLRYRPRQLPAPTDPFDKVAVATKPDEIDARQGEGFDKLLAWLSAAGSGTWRKFVVACDTLKITGLAIPARSILRRFRLLGHIEVSRNGQEWTIGPSVCISAATDLSTQFLAGARTARALGRWADPVFARLQPDLTGPSWIQVPESGQLPADCVAVGQSAIILGQHLLDLAGWKHGLQVLDRVNSAAFSIEHLNGVQFETCVFIEARGQHQSPSGVYRLTRGEGATMRRFIAFFDAVEGKWRQGDWYGLCFLARQERSAKPVIYDSARTCLLIPATERWPLIYEKALVLASGFLPTHDSSMQRLCYEGVPRNLAETLTRKLNLPLEERTYV